jgi:amphi-Trp domain-containing protein
MEIEKQPVKEKKIVQGHFSQEFYMSSSELAKFLRNLADQVEAEGDLKITTEEWILPFSPASHAKVDVDLEEDELEIEIEFKRSTGKLYAESEPETEKTGDDEQTNYQY